MCDLIMTWMTACNHQQLCGLGHWNELLFSKTLLYRYYVSIFKNIKLWCVCIVVLSEYQYQFCCFNLVRKNLITQLKLPPRYLVKIAFKCIYIVFWNRALKCPSQTPWHLLSQLNQRKINTSSSAVAWTCCVSMTLDLILQIWGISA